MVPLPPADVEFAATGWLFVDHLGFKETWALSASCQTEGELHNVDSNNMTLEQLEAEAVCFAQRDDLWKNRLDAAKIIFVPPLGLFIFGCLILWTVRGFAPQSK
jgi:hypothetical protein